MSLVVQARKKAEQGEAAIAAQLAIISELEREGVDATSEKNNLVALVLARDAAMDTMERFLDELDQTPVFQMGQATQQHA